LRACLFHLIHVTIIGRLVGLAHQDYPAVVEVYSLNNIDDLFV
jgi:hypothetical protein